MSGYTYALILRVNNENETTITAVRTRPDCSSSANDWSQDDVSITFHGELLPVPSLIARRQRIHVE